MSRLVLVTETGCLMHHLIEEILHTPTCRIRSEILIVGAPGQLPPGSYNGCINRMVLHDFSSLERRIELSLKPDPKRPKKYKDVPFWCKRR